MDYSRAVFGAQDDVSSIHYRHLNPSELSHWQNDRAPSAVQQHVTGLVVLGAHLNIPYVGAISLICGYWGSTADGDITNSL